MMKSVKEAPAAILMFSPATGKFVVVVVVPAVYRVQAYFIRLVNVFSVSAMR